MLAALTAFLARSATARPRRTTPGRLLPPRQDRDGQNSE